MQKMAIARWDIFRSSRQNRETEVSIEAKCIGLEYISGLNGTYISTRRASARAHIKAIIDNVFLFVLSIVARERSCC